MFRMWFPPMPVRGLELMHLWHSTMSKQDYQIATWIRDNDAKRNWNDIGTLYEKNNGETDFARFNYYDGKNPTWPEDVLRAEYGFALKPHEDMRTDNRTAMEIIANNRMPFHQIPTKGLTQVTTGSPQPIYNGGLLRATVRYFDQDRGRPGLPRDVAALVETLSEDGVGVHLVNTGRGESRNVIVQAGAYGEHSFRNIRFRQAGKDGETVAPVNARVFAVHLPPSTSIRIDAGLNRFANKPSYAFPWHGERIPIPFK